MYESIISVFAFGFVIFVGLVGEREEREDLINIEDDDKDEFNNEWETKTRSRAEIPRISSGPSRNRHVYGGHSSIPAITSGPR